MQFYKNITTIGLTIALLLTLSQSVFSAGVDIKSFKLIGSPPHYQVETSVSFELTEHMKAALLKGVTLNAQVEFHLGEHRNWWLNGDTSLKVVRFTLKYHALSQHYLLSRLDTDEHWNFTSLPAALRKLGEPRRYKLPKITESAQTLKEDNYYIFGIANIAPESLRLPLKIRSLFSDEFSLSSEGVLWPLP